MSWAPLVVLGLLGWNAAPDPEALVARLSAPGDADREEAAATLEELGRDALPALRRAGDAADPELGRRIAFLIDLIERQRLLRATRVQLDFEDRPLAEVAEAIRSRTGFRLMLEPDDALGARRVTLREAEPVTFWDLLNRLEESCTVGHRPEIPWSTNARELTIRLGASEGPRLPTSDAGPFRVYLVRLSRHRELTPANATAPETSRESLSAELHVLAEPGLAVNPTGPLVLQEAIDDRGRDLRPEFPAESAHRRERPPRFEEGIEGLFPLQVTLGALPGPAGRLKRFKGYIPITVIARTGGPIVVPLAGAEGKPFTGGGLTLSVDKMTRKGETASFLLSMSGDPTLGSGSPAAPRRLGEFRPPFRLEDHVQIQDERGRALRWNPSGPGRQVNGDVLETRLLVYARNGATPTRLLYHGVVGAVTQVAFEFGDVALP